MTAVVPRFPTISDDSVLDGLPVGAIVRDAQGDAVQCMKRVGAWFYAQHQYQFTSDDIPLPALLLFHPDWSGS